LHLAPDTVAAHRALGSAYLSLEQYDRAAGAYRRCAQLDGEDAECRSGLGRAHYLNYEFENAIPAFAQLLRLRPGDAAASNWLGRSYQGLDQHEAALPHLEAAVAVQPDNPAYLLDLGLVLVDVGKTQDALQVQRRLTSLDAQRAASLQSYMDDAG
jgi:tetratricopeptide (TPR) repeat protein